MNEFTMPEGFEKIWERVIARNEDLPVAITQSDELLKFILSEYYILSGYANILTMCSPKERGQISKMAAAQRENIRSLQLEYFMETGDIAQNKNIASPRKMGLLSALREQYNEEKSAVEAYINASHNRKGEIATIYAEIADEKRLRSLEIKAIISKTM